MIERYTHVFRYGGKQSGDRQRWAFRFSIVDPEPRVGRGRPPAIAVVSCHELWGKDGPEPFWTAREAALQCDAWKCYLWRNKGVKNFSWSHGSYDKAALAYLAKYDHSIEDFDPPRELMDFIKENSDELFKLEASAGSLAWDAGVVLNEAEKILKRAREGAPNCVDLNYAHAVRQWAVEYKDHMKLVEEFEAYGAHKFDEEISRYIAGIERILKCAPWHLPTKAHWRFIKWLDKYRARREAFRKLLEELKAEQMELRGFAASVPLRVEELKRERLKISLSQPVCNETGGTPNGSENGAASQDANTTEKSTPTIPPQTIPDTKTS